MEDLCVSLLLQLRGRRQSYKSMFKKGQLAPAEIRGPSLTRACQMEQMTGTNGAHIGVTATHWCTHSQTDGGTCRCRTNAPPFTFRSQHGVGRRSLARWSTRTCYHPTAAHPASSRSARTRTYHTPDSTLVRQQCQKCLIPPPPSCSCAINHQQVSS